ncbi:Quercetin dioxygenase-like cupin family protein OS=Streptomyces griseomycini OX=66895 GN=FHS37_006105 PE=4 SV=1 [Streptomyces griseomycini]
MTARDVVNLDTLLRGKEHDHGLIGAGRLLADRMSRPSPAGAR